MHSKRPVSKLQSRCAGCRAGSAEGTQVDSALQPALGAAAQHLPAAPTLKGHFLNCQALPEQTTATTRSQSLRLVGSLSAQGTRLDGAHANSEWVSTASVTSRASKVHGRDGAHTSGQEAKPMAV